MDGQHRRDMQIAGLLIYKALFTNRPQELGDQGHVGRVTRGRSASPAHA